MDIRPPKLRKKLSSSKPDSTESILPNISTVTPLPEVKKYSKKQWKTYTLVGVAVALLGASLSSLLWYNWALTAPSMEDNNVRVVVAPGDTAASIATTLRDHDLIRSRLAFSIYTQLSGTRSKLQAGGYVLSPNQDVASIVEHMVGGKTDEIDLTIPPGLTLDELRDHFFRDGFNQDEITVAFNQAYDHPLLASRPQGASLEGYIYPETYRMNANQALGELFERSFDQMYTVLQENKYLEEYTKRNLSIHDAVTLASIVQKEVKDPTDQKQVAQVFLKRLGMGMQLGSDVTYMYAAEQMGIEGSPSLESPYNTRKYVGLPPGPIANMNPSSLDAVAFPAAGDFLYFVAGDDGITYFSRTEAEHNANVKAHCKTLCQ